MDSINRNPEGKIMGKFKTMAVIAEVRQNAHAGEEYDVIMIVENVPTVDTIDRWADLITREVRNLFQQDRNANGDGKIAVTLDGPSAYNAILMNLQIILKQSEGIEIALPYLGEDFFKIEDVESRELLEKLGKGN
jgi:hypothetical protein